MSVPTLEQRAPYAFVGASTIDAPAIMQQATTHPAGVVGAAATYNSERLLSYGARGLVLIVDVTVVPQTSPVMTPKLQVWDGVSSKWADHPIATWTATTTVGTKVFVLYPGVTDTAATHRNMALPPVFRVVLTTTGTGSPSTHTLTAGVWLIP